MPGSTTTSIFEEIGVKPVINAVGHQTLLGGSQLSPRVRAAMDEANRYYVDMPELLDRTGQIIAKTLGAEAAYVTSGCAAALALSSAACLAGADPEKIAQLPDTTGLRNEILIQKSSRYHYDRCLTVSGARLVEYGTAEGATVADLDAAIGPRTAAVHYFAAAARTRPGILPLGEVVDHAHRRGIPVIVDAAAEVYPLDLMQSYPRSGADLVCYGAKYIDAPNSSGILCGRQELVAAAAKHGFIAYETDGGKALGRPFKLDRQEIIAVVVALQEWFSRDHEARLTGYDRMIKVIAERIRDVPGITLIERPGDHQPSTRLEVTVQPRPDGKNAAKIVQALRDGNPSIRLALNGDVIGISVATVTPGDERVIADRLREALGG
ncbi:MAG TPA: aminotransferase class V-fold PLP-dependent enzyme [Chloroflexota bacterium]|nr:aminotransferase class V-fold PLP-dependent enzyme [Chloroflexota bacterium]